MKGRFFLSRPSSNYILNDITLKFYYYATRLAKNSINKLIYLNIYNNYTKNNHLINCFRILDKNKFPFESFDGLNSFLSINSAKQFLITLSSKFVALIKCEIA
jgi:hypothetical protein